MAPALLQRLETEWQRPCYDRYQAGYILYHQTSVVLCLQDTLDQYLQDRKLQPVMQAVIGGKMAQQIICKSVDYQSEKEEEFYQASTACSGQLAVSAG